MLVDIDGSLTWEGEMPQRDRPNRSWWRVLDERSAAGGRAKAWLFLTHPGPSLLVTALVVAAAALLTRQPAVRAARRRSGADDAARASWRSARSTTGPTSALDAVAKPYKPIPRGAGAARQRRWASRSPGSPSRWRRPRGSGPRCSGVDALGRGRRGRATTSALKRTPLAVLAWWAGFVVVPLIGMVATGRLHGAAAAVPLAGLLALAVLLANGLPDIEGDRRGGAHTLAGRPRAGALALGDGARASALAALYVAALRGRARPGRLGPGRGGPARGRRAAPSAAARGATGWPSRCSPCSSPGRRSAGWPRCRPQRPGEDGEVGVAEQREGDLAQRGAVGGQRRARLLDGDGRGQLDREPVDAGADRRADHRRAAVLGGEREGAAVRGAQLVGLAVLRRRASAARPRG